MKSESTELVSGLIRQYRRLRLLYLGYLAAAVLALVFFLSLIHISEPTRRS